MRVPKGLVFDMRIGAGLRLPTAPGCSPFKWEGQVPTEGKRNTYICQVGHRTNTIHVDEGVTPFMIGCHFCGQSAQSMFYSGVDMGDIHGVWSKIPNAWWGDKIEQGKHASNGGVFLYAVKEAR